MNHAKLDARTEDLIDAVGLPSLLESIVRVAQDKAEHIRSNRQDEELAAGWDRAVTLIEAMLTGEFPY